MYKYDVQIFIVLKPESTSPFIIISSVTPFIWHAYLSATKSNQPHLLDRPVVAPNSFPTTPMVSPSLSKSSVGNGPDPTLVVYALKIPYTFFIELGATPNPVQAPAAVVLEEVTYGYVPKSISKSEPCAPSAKIDLLFFWALNIYSSESVKFKLFNTSIDLKNSSSSSSKL